MKKVETLIPSKISPKSLKDYDNYLSFSKDLNPVIRIDLNEYEKLSKKERQWILHSFFSWAYKELANLNN